MNEYAFELRKKLYKLCNKDMETMEFMPVFGLPDKLSSYLKCHSADPRVVHSLSLKLGCLCSTFLSNNLLQAYTSRSNAVNARKLFEEIPHPNVVTWSAIISCCSQMGNLKDAMHFFRELLQSDLLPNKFTFGSVVTGCTRVKDLRTGVQIHCSAVKFGVELDTFVAGTLIDMYGKCGKLDDSWRVFDRTPNKDVVSWTTMITNLANSRQHGLRNAAFGLFKDMVSKGVWPVGMTVASLVKVFDEPKKLNEAKQAHGYMVKFGIEVDHLLGSALVAMYGRCAAIDEVVRLSFRTEGDVVSWTSLLVAYMQNGYNVKAIEVFQKMVEEKMMIDKFVIASVLGACSALEEARKGKEIHGYAIRYSLISDVTVGNSLITLYGRCGDTGKAERVFRLVGDKDIISWTAMLTCYSQNGCGAQAVFFFRRMLREGISLSIYIVTGAIRACSIIASLSIGKQIHSRSIRMGIDGNLSVENSLITMYAKCGNMEAASSIFYSMTKRDLVSWNALITGFSHHGFKSEALELFNQMQKEGVQPDDYTFIGVLVSCSRVGLVADGCKYFKLMKETYGLEPKVEHYACMVDLFGRAGDLRSAVDIINSMPCDPDHLVWETLLASCKAYGDIELGKFAAMKILEMTKDASPYIALSNIHASMGMWDTKACFREMMRDHGVQKEPGRSWIESKLWSEDRHDAVQVEGIQ